MKTAVSIPDEIYRRAEKYARTAGKSRSEVYSAALREYLARHGRDEVTEGLNAVLDEAGDGRDDFVQAAARGTLERTEW
jgi:metal-responsive CopG/Arc/MetJ family transcriptional regulator